MSALDDALEAEPRKVREGWLNILGVSPLMPREVTMPWKGKGRYQETVSTTGQYLDLCARRADEADMWVGMYPTSLYGSTTFSRAFWDVDSPDLEDALDRARRAEEKAMTDFNVMPAATFTGGKGFHLHLEHDPLEGYGRSYEEATTILMRDAKAYLDPGPLKNRKSSPRIPYTFYGKSYALHKRPMYCIPVDLTWDLADIMEAAEHMVVTPFKVPHSQELTRALRPHMAAINRRIEGTKAKGLKDDFVQELVNAAIGFSDTFGYRLVNRHGVRDGRRRVMYALLVPALMHQHRGQMAPILQRMESWVELAGGRWSLYKHFVEQCVHQCTLDSGQFRLPMSLKRWLCENSDLRPLPPKKR